jgi:hypothetical protein
MSINGATFDATLLPLLLWSWGAVACAALLFAAVLLLVLPPWRSRLSPGPMVACAILLVATALWALVLADGWLATYHAYYVLACGASACAPGEVATRIDQVGGGPFLASDIGGAHLRGVVLVAVTIALLTLVTLVLRRNGRRFVTLPTPPPHHVHPAP